MVTSQYLSNTLSLRCTEVTGVEPISLAEAKTFLRVDHDDEDSMIEVMIAAIRDHAEGRTHRVLRQSTWEWTVSGLSGVCQVPLTPCSACSGIVMDGEEVDTELFTFRAGDMSPLFATVTASEYFPEGEATLTLTAGYPDGQVPEGILRWMQIRLGDAYEQRESFAVGVHFFEFSHNFVDSLLDPYRIVDV